MNPNVTLGTTYHPWRKLKATNFTSSSFTTKKSVIITSPPTGDGVLDEFAPKSGQFGSPVANWLLLRFFGAGSNDQTFDCRVWGWRLTLNAAGTPVAYDPMLLAHLTLTLGNSLSGIVGGAILDTDLEADTISLTSGTGATGDVIIVSPANDIRGAWVAIDMRGSLFPELDFDMTGATSGNALWAKG